MIILSLGHAIHNPTHPTTLFAPPPHHLICSPKPHHIYTPRFLINQGAFNLTRSILSYPTTNNSQWLHLILSWWVKGKWTIYSDQSVMWGLFCAYNSEKTKCVVFFINAQILSSFKRAQVFFLSKDLSSSVHFNLKECLVYFLLFSFFLD